MGNRHLVEFLTELGYSWTEDDHALCHLASGRRRWSPVITWATRSAWRKQLSLWGCPLLLRLTRSMPFLRIAMHPFDFDHPESWPRSSGSWPGPNGSASKRSIQSCGCGRRHDSRRPEPSLQRRGKVPVCTSDEQRQFRRGFWATALGTLASRVLGNAARRDDRQSAGAGGRRRDGRLRVAFRMANLARRLLGEGALATSYLPVLAAELRARSRSGARPGRHRADPLAGVLTLLVLAGEAICGLVWIRSGPGDTRLLVGSDRRPAPLLVVYLFGGTTFGHAASLGQVPPAGIGRHAAQLRLAGRCLVGCTAPGPYRHGPGLCAGRLDRDRRALQAGIQLAALGRLGLRRAAEKFGRVSDETAGWPGSGSFGRWARSRLALSVTQLSTLIDSSLAWLLTRPARRTGSDRLAAGRTSPIRCVPEPPRHSTTPNGFISCRSDFWAWRQRRSSFRS